MIKKLAAEQRSVHKWALEAPSTNEPLRWAEVWRRPDNTWLVETAERSSHNWVRANYRLRTQRRGGAVCIAATAEPEPRFILVRQERPAPGIWCWEAPRGGMEAEDQSLVETALRELKEEAGVTAQRPTLIGFQYPDSGTLADRVAVVLADLPETQLENLRPSKETEECSLFTRNQLEWMIAEGTVRDSITLGAFAMAFVHRKWG